MKPCATDGHSLVRINKMSGSDSYYYFCRVCIHSWNPANVIGESYLCPACGEKGIVDKAVLILSKSRNLLCPSCSEKLNRIHIALEQMRCEGFFSDTTVHKRTRCTPSHS